MSALPEGSASLAILFIACFLIGSIPWGLIISKTFFGKDVRKVGSGNIGTTNVMRTVGKRGGAAVFVLDFGKGLLSGFLGAANAAWFAPDLAQVSLAVAFLGCVWGHIFSPWLGFKGGKGIAVAIGCLFVTFGVAWSLVELASFIVVVAITRYVSAGSLMAAVICPFIALHAYWGDWVAFALISIAAITVIWAHRSNICRLVHGEENRIGSKKDAEGKAC